MVLSYTKIETAGANRQMSMKDIYQRGHMARATLERIREGNSVTMRTAGKLAEILEVDVKELIQDGQ